MIAKFKQGCGDTLIVERKSSIKANKRFLYEGHFEGYTKNYTFQIYEAKSGRVKNLEKPNLNGFFVGKHNTIKSIYYVWKNMERRCYDPRSKYYNNYGAKGVTVDDRFKNYEFFESWYLENWDGSSEVAIDKDCLSYGLDHKVYSPETCLLLPREINMFISSLGTGIYKVSRKLPYCVNYRRKNKKLAKNFETKEEAINFKRQIDLQYLEELFKKYSIKEKVKCNIKHYVEIFVC